MIDLEDGLNVKGYYPSSATKALQAADLVVKSNGVIVLLAECPEEISNSHGALIKKFGFRLLTAIEQLLKEEQITDYNVASYLAKVGNILNKIKVVLVSKGIIPEEARNLGFYAQASTPQEA